MSVAKASTEPGATARTKSTTQRPPVRQRPSHEQIREMAQMRLYVRLILQPFLATLGKRDALWPADFAQEPARVRKERALFGLAAWAYCEERTPSSKAWERLLRSASIGWCRGERSSPSRTVEQ